MAETEKINKIIFDIGGIGYEFDGGGGGSQPGPNTVGTEQIIDDSVIMDDLNQSVKDAMVTGDDRVTEEELNTFDV